MATLLADVSAEGEPAWAAALAMPGVKLHLYGKVEARPGRKMGHLTATAASPDEAEALVREARDRLTT
jgi:5-(carboxyamino)imidazole ribonucleotide synthase